MRSLGRITLLLVVGGAIALPTLALAQTPYSVSLRKQPYQELPISHPDAQQEQTYTPGTSGLTEIDFPFRFFDVDRPKLWVSPQGYIQFDSLTVWRHGNQVIPTSTLPAAIAPFWDDLDVQGSGAHLKSQIIGRAPNRILVIEWRAGMWSMGTAFANFQVWLRENSSTIEFHYGTINSSGGFHASMGIQLDEHLGYQVPVNADGSSCSPNCNASNWPENTVVTFSQGPEIQTSEVTGQAEAFAGLPMALSAKVSNIGGKPAENFTLRFHISKQPELDGMAIELATLDSDVRSLDPQESTVFTASPRLPITLEEGQYYIIAEADPHKVVPETSRGDNFSAFGPFQIGIRAPNLTLEWVDVPDLAAPGETVPVRWKVSNTGNLGAVEIPYKLSLAPSDGHSPSWIPLGYGMIGAMEMGDELILSDEVTLPQDAEIGIHYIMVEVNHHRVVFEHERGDNSGLSNPLFVSEEELVVVTKDLPPAHFQGHYSVRLHAAGGDGIHRWRLGHESVLPPGLSLVEELGSNGNLATFLRGVPSHVGDYEFSLNVSSGELIISEAYSLSVDVAAFELVVTKENLASAAFGFAYQDELTAIGGTPPYTWDAQGSLPLGIMLSSDGVLSGRPQRDGSFTIPFRVRDAEGREGSKELTLYVAPPSSLTCVTRELPPLAIGEQFDTNLVAAGGETGEDGGYFWTSADTVRLAREPGDDSEKWTGPPPGVSLNPNGHVRITASEFGSFVWNVNVQEAASSAQVVTCPIRIDVPSDHGLTVVTTRLPAAVAGRSYRATLEASGGEGDLVWSEFGGGRLLEDLGLRFETTGELVGTPSIDALEGLGQKELTATVRVQDERKRTGVGVISLTLTSGPATTTTKSEDGARCQAGSGAAAPWALVLLALALLRRRR